MNKNILTILIVAALIIAGGYFAYNQSKNSGSTDSFLSAQEAAEKGLKYINESILPEGISASIIEVFEKGDVYAFKMKVQDTEHISYVTKDGNLLFVEGIDLNNIITEQEEPIEEVTQKERPDIKLFIMSYCPYGLQAQKMYLPVYDLLSDKADMGIYFVNYIMHGEKEIEENLRQYCIQKEQKDKFFDYLSCFVEKGDYTDTNIFKQCLSQAQIDETKLSSCVAATDESFDIYSQYADKSTWLSGNYPKFDVHADLNSQYGVSGSPTIVINGKVVSISPRSPEKFKEVICQAFSTQPQECSQILSDQAFSPGFGLEEGESTTAGCGS